MVMGKDLTLLPILYSALHDAEKVLGRSINPTLTSVAEWQEKRAKKNSFATKVAGQPKLFVLGSEDDLRPA